MRNVAAVVPMRCDSLLPMPNSMEFQSTVVDEAPSRPETGLGVVLIHGITGTPTEMRPLARHLERLGYRVEVPLVPGHGAGYRELLATTWQDWLSGVREAVRQLAMECSGVVIVGLSAGGLLASLVADECPEAVGLVLLSLHLGIPGPHITRFAQWAYRLIARVPILRRHWYFIEPPPYGLKDERLQQRITAAIATSRRGETTQFGLFRTYVDTLRQMDMLEAEVRRAASRIRCPTFMLHSVEDTMLSIRNATAMYGLLGASDKAIRFIAGCDHVMTVDLRKEDVARDVGAFIAHVTRTTSTLRCADA